MDPRPTLEPAPGYYIRSKPLPPGETFISAGNKQVKQWNSEAPWQKLRWGLPVLPHKPGSQEYIQYRNRRYLCEIIGLIETRTGVHRPEIDSSGKLKHTTRWWQFLYLVKVLES